MNNSKTIRCTLACILALGLCALSGCKKKEDKSDQPSSTANQSNPSSPVTQPQSRLKSTPLVSITDRNAEPAVLTTPPPGMFDVTAHPDASILTAMDINKLSESERQFGIAPRRTKDVEYADGVIVVEEGDKAGGHKYNLALSQRRSAAVKQALVERYHINPNRLSTGGNGDYDPVDTNDTLEGRARNGRVELTLD